MMGTLILLMPLVPYGALRLAEPNPGPTVTFPVAVTPELPRHPKRPPGAFGDPDAEGPSSPLSDRAVRSAARGWEWKRLESPRWKILATDHFALRGDVPIDDLRAAATYLEEFHRMVQKAVGGPPRESATWPSTAFHTLSRCHPRTLHHRPVPGVREFTDRGRYIRGGLLGVGRRTPRGAG